MGFQTVRGEELIEIPEGKEVDDVRALHKGGDNRDVGTARSLTAASMPFVSAFDPGFEELGERDMSLLAQRLREAGLEELLKTLFK